MGSYHEHYCAGILLLRLRSWIDACMLLGGQKSSLRCHLRRTLSSVRVHIWGRFLGEDRHRVSLRIPPLLVCMDVYIIYLWGYSNTLLIRDHFQFLLTVAPTFAGNGVSCMGYTLSVYIYIYPLSRYLHWYRNMNIYLYFYSLLQVTV